MGAVTVALLPLARHCTLLHVVRAPRPAESRLPVGVQRFIVKRTQQFQDMLDRARQTRPEDLKTVTGVRQRLTVRAQLYTKALLESHPPLEHFLRALPSRTDAIDVVVPNTMDARMARRGLRIWASKSAEYHRKWAVLCLLCVPMSAVLSVLPLPNVVLLYNVYRLHVNFACMRAATAVCHSELHIVLDSALGDCYVGAKLSSSWSGPIDDSQLRCLANTLNRDQIARIGGQLRRRRPGRIASST
ncbi:Letm1 RBD domain-containing protein [Plasmodiophora brassicae]|uniref:Uncharacterized protein n=1 Tax=Plasmodiophora brassicae TaxID=37360 RepID=A0A3P3Y8W5_PLABS|nr:unnamed protein product [Plasmodiophora brassicae]